MLNNKKSLLQRARIAMVAIVTIISIGGAFAVTPNHKVATQTWGVLQTIGTNYVVTALTPNSKCTGSTGNCEVSSSVARNPMTHQIPIAGASTVAFGVFSK